LAGRDAPGLTDQLLTLLHDDHPDVQYAAVRALAGRDAPGLTDQLLTLLHDDNPNVQYAAARALAGRDRPEDLLLVASEAPALPPRALADAYRAAEQLAASVYGRLPPHSQAAVRSDLAWLTAAVLGQ
jgi:HEAT repeat protein